MRVSPTYASLRPQFQRHKDLWNRSVTIWDPGFDSLHDFEGHLQNFVDLSVDFLGRGTFADLEDLTAAR